MTKINFPIGLAADNPFSLRHPLPPNEVMYFKRIFKEIASCIDNVPSNLYDKMENIEEQFNADNKMSDKQMRFVESVHAKYC